jgi:rare lipoprotein A (peptidoglycan hydrolase)
MLKFIVGFMLGCMVGCSGAHAEVASWYAPGLDHVGHRTASGEYFTGNEMTAAHKTLPFGTMVTLCHSGCVTVKINDRGPFVKGRDFDLSHAAAAAIGCLSLCNVSVGGGGEYRQANANPGFGFNPFWQQPTNPVARRHGRR